MGKKPLTVCVFLLVAIAVLITIVKLLEDVFEFLRDREPQMGCILQDAHALIGQIEKDYSGPKDTAVLDHVDIHHLGYTDQEENNDLPHDPAEADLTRELLVCDRAHDAGDIVRCNKDKQGE